MVAFLIGHPAGPRRILDLGAGTGQLSESLVAAGHDVIAADTSAGMLTQLTARLPGVPAFVAGAEDLPVPDDDVDAVVAGQAAHWFDPARASAEFLVGYVLWSVWLIAFGVVVLVRERRRAAVPVPVA